MKYSFKKIQDGLFLVMILVFVAVLFSLISCTPDDPILSPAKLEVSPVELNFQQNFNQLTFTIKNVGQQRMSWTITESVVWIVNFQSTNGLIDGGGQNQITVSIDRSTLNFGDNTNNIQVIATAEDGGTLQGGAKDVIVKAFRPIPPQVTFAQSDINNIGATTVIYSARIEVLGSSTVTQHGHVWSTVANPDLGDSNDSRTNLGERLTTGSFSSNLTGLTANTQYFIRAYAVSSVATVYSGEVTFTTAAMDNLPQVAMALSDLSQITENSAVVTANLSDLGSNTVTDHGHLWGTSSGLNIDNHMFISRLSVQPNTGLFTSNISSLTSGTLYYIRAYATNSAGTSYSEEISFTTIATANLPQVAMALSDLSQITENSVVVTANLSDLGSNTVTDHGHLWGTSSGLNIGNHMFISRLSVQPNTGLFTSNISSLTSGTLYYIRAYATNSAGTSYSDEISFTTIATGGVGDLAILTTGAVTALHTTSAMVEGDITYIGTSNVIRYGHVYATHNNPELNMDNEVSVTISVTNPLSYISNLTGLTNNTLYYVKAFAVNSSGVSYGNELSFITNIDTPPSTPNLLTPANLSIVVGIRPTLTWQASMDANDDNLLYDVYIDQTTSPTTLMASNLTTTSWTSATDLNLGEKYYWKIEAKDAINSTMSSTFSFNTGISFQSETNSAWGQGRYSHTSVVFGNKIWMMGGFLESNSSLDEVWSNTNGSSWTQVVSDAPWGNRFGHTSAVTTITSLGNKIWVIGGLSGANSILSDVWSSTDGINWNIETTNLGATVTQHASVIYDGKIWILGGRNLLSPFNHVRNSSDGISWNLLTARNVFSARYGHAAVVFNNKMWVMGGRSSSSNFFNDVWNSSDGMNWTRVTSNANWSARSGHTVVVFENKMWLIGGDTNEVWFSTNGTDWSLATDTAWTQGKRWHTSVVFGGKIWVIGGYNGSTADDEVWSSER